MKQLHRSAACFRLQVELLWTNVALNRRNVVPVLDFLIAHGLQECNANRPAQVSVPPQLGLTSTMKGAHVHMTVVTPQFLMAGRLCIVCLQFIEAEVFLPLLHPCSNRTPRWWRLT